MSDLSEKFSSLETQLATQNATIAGYIDTVEAKLQAVLDLMDIMNVNNAANTKFLAGAIGQSAACFPCPTPTIVVPPIDTTTNPVDEDRCKRSQAFVKTIHDILAAMDTMQSFNVIGTYNVVHDAISEIISGIAAGDTVPLPSFPETVNIVGDYIGYAGERVFSGVGLIEQFSPLESGLINAMYSTSSADTAQSAFNASIDGSSASNGAKLLFKALGYNALYSYFFDPTTTPDLSGFDGGACTLPPGTCFEFTSVASVGDPNGVHTTAIAETFGPFVPAATVSTTDVDQTYTPGIWYAQDFTGWTFQVLTGTMIIQYRAGGLGSHTSFIEFGAFDSGSGEHAFPSGTGTLVMFNGVVFSVRICSPSE